MAKKIPLNEMLLAIDKNDKSYYNKFTEDQRKEFSAWLVMRYASCTKDCAEHSLLMVNDLVNHNFTSLGKHPELQWKLIAMCGVGTKMWHPFIRPGRKKGKSKVQAVLAEIYPNYKLAELELVEKMNSKAELKDLLESTGRSDKEIKELLK